MAQAKINSRDYELWARRQFRLFAGCVAFVETADETGDIGIGTCFHVGEGTFVTARHVVEDRSIRRVGFDDSNVLRQFLEKRENWGPKPHGSVMISSGPHFHPNATIDVACFRADPYPERCIPLGGHLDDWMGEHELLLYRTLVLGYPRIAFSDRPVLVASVGEVNVNALIDKYIGGHPHFIISTMARGGFSGAPVLVAYNEHNRDGGTAALGLVTEALVSDGQAAELGYLAVLTVEPIYDCLTAHSLLPKAQAFEPYSK